jgi:hypothetical protein
VTSICGDRITAVTVTTVDKAGEWEIVEDPRIPRLCSSCPGISKQRDALSRFANCISMVVFDEMKDFSHRNLVLKLLKIEAALQTTSQADISGRELVQALEKLTRAILKETALNTTQKHIVADFVLGIAQRISQGHDDRSHDLVMAAMAWIPSVVSDTKNLAVLWEKAIPPINSYLGIDSKRF